MLLDLKNFDQFIHSFRAITMHDQWGSHVAKVGGKMFMALGFKGLWDDLLVFKTSEPSFHEMIEQKGIVRAPHAHKGSWIAVSEIVDFRDDELKLYLEHSYKLICLKLTKKLRIELGFDRNAL